MADIPLDRLKVGDRVIATQIGGNTKYKGIIADLQWFPAEEEDGVEVLGEEVIVWIERTGGKGRIGLRMRAEEEPPQWTFQDVDDLNKRARGLAEVAAFKQAVPEDIIHSKLAPLLGLKQTAKKGKGRRRRKTRKSRR